MTYIWFWVHSLGEDAPKSRFTKFFRLTGRDPRAGAKIIFKLLFVTQRRVLRKNQRALYNRQNWGI